jgi:hypothetical protein
MGPPAAPPAAPRRSPLLPALLAAAVAAGWAGWNAWSEQRTRTAPLDLDGWGWLITRLQTDGRDPALLLSAPSLWKGPVVPFVLGLCYFVAPTLEAVLAFNAGFFALSAAALVLAFHSLGAGRWAATAAVLG